MIVKYKKSSFFIAMLMGLASEDLLAFNAPEKTSFFSITSLSVGPLLENDFKAKTFSLTPEIEKTFTASNNKTAAFVELFLGKPLPLLKSFAAEWGIAIAASSRTTVSGIIWDDADPRFDNYTYKYHIQHSHVAVKAKLFLPNTLFNFKPNIYGSLGAGFNQSKDYTNTPTIFPAIENPNFTNKMTTAVTYTLGIGLQKTLSPNCRAGFSYEFSDWGKIHLDRAFGQTLNDGLGQKHFYTNAILLNITYYS